MKESRLVRMKAAKDDDILELPFLYGNKSLLQEVIWQFKEGI